MHHTTKEPGFSLVEVIVIVAIIPLLISSFILALYKIQSDATIQDITLKMNSGLQNAYASIEKDVRYASTFMSTVASSTYPDDQFGPDDISGTWSHQGTPANANSRALLLQNFATSTNKFGTSRQLVYYDDPGTPSINCSTSPVSYNPAREYIIAYFIRNQKLYRRTFTNLSANCSSVVIAQLQSCPPDLKNTWNTAKCKVSDEVIAEQVSRFSVEYYTERGTTALDVYGGSPTAAPSDAKEVEVTLELSQQYGGSPITAARTLRISKEN